MTTNSGDHANAYRDGSRTFLHMNDLPSKLNVDITCADSLSISHYVCFPYGHGHTCAWHNREQWSHHQLTAHLGNGCSVHPLGNRDGKENIVSRKGSVAGGASCHTLYNARLNYTTPWRTSRPWFTDMILANCFPRVSGRIPTALVDPAHQQTPHSGSV